MPRVNRKRAATRGANGTIYVICKPIRLLTFGVCILVSCCDGPKTTWSAESRSPDGKMIATARTIQTSGIGTGDPGTFIYLNRTKGSQSPTIILALLADEPGDMDVGMNWLSQTHLELTYKGHRSIDFQAVKCHGIEISTRELSNGSVNSSQ
jgi:hypothetical protein